MRILLFSLILLLPLPLMARPKNICQIIRSHPKWYKVAKATAKTSGVPVPVQMAIIQEESHFKPDARNHRSTAFGYAQALNHIWDTYKVDTDHPKQTRNNFTDASAFIGWYADLMQKEVNISPKNAYQLYLAYHDGSGGYVADVHKKHDPTKQLAQHVQHVASLYRAQLSSC